LHINSSIRPAEKSIVLDVDYQVSI